MKKIAFFFFTWVATLGIIQAQSLTPDVISVAGSTGSTDMVQLDWTLGEVAVSTLQKQELMLTEGFHQPVIKIKLWEKPDDSALQVEVYPNPSKDYIKILIPEKSEHEIIRLTDQKAQVLSQTKLEEGTRSSEMYIGDLPGGMYYLSIYSTDGSLLVSYQIVKI